MGSLGAELPVIFRPLPTWHSPSTGPCSWGQERRRTKNSLEGVSITKEQHSNHPWENHTPLPCLTLNFQLGIVGMLKYLCTFSVVLGALLLKVLFGFLSMSLIFTCIYSHDIYFSWEYYLLSFHNVTEGSWEDQRGNKEPKSLLEGF